MLIGVRFVLFLGLLLVLGTGLLWLSPIWLNGVADGLSDLIRDCVRYNEEQQTAEELDQIGDSLLQRSETKEVVIRELIAGRISYRQAAAAFLDINTQLPSLSFPTCDGLGTTIEEWSYRQVLRWARSRLQGTQGIREKRLLARLERELDELLHEPDPLQLPGSLH